jgi:hypothetical protein
MKIAPNSKSWTLFGIAIFLTWCSAKTVAGFQQNSGQQPVIARFTPAQLKTLISEVYPDGLSKKPVKWLVTIYSVKNGNIVYRLTPPDSRIRFEYMPRTILPSGKVQAAGPEDF